jgi:hypothetical protein
MFRTEIGITAKTDTAMRDKMTDVQPQQGIGAG